MKENRKAMGDNILKYMRRDGIERKDLAKALGVPYSSLTDWINGNSYPRIDKIERMAKFFGISKAELVEEDPPIHDLSERELRLVSQYRKLTDEGQEKVDSYLHDLVRLYGKTVL